MVRPKLTLYVDVISPFAYMAFYVIRTNPTFKGVDLDLIPIFLGGVMQSTGNRPPLTIQNKGAYLMRDRARSIKKYKIPMSENFPEPFPQPTIQASRALCAVKAKYPNKLVAATTELFNALWLDTKLVGTPQVIEEYLSRVLSEAEVKEVIELSTQAEYKKQLTDNTDQAIKQGCFGLPYIVATNSKGESDTFWGFDHLGQVVDHLGLEKQGEGFHAML